MMKKQLLKHAAAALALTTLATACITSTNKNTDVINKQNVEENVREFVYPLPTAFEVTEMLNRIEAAYIIDICNPQSNVDKYLTEPKRAFNLGVYSADLCYASTYNQQQTVMDYMESIRALIDALDMTQAVDPDLPSKIEDNENNKSELTKLITESFYDSYDYLNKNDRGPVSLLIVAGSWIEGLFLTTHISEDTYNNKEMVKIVMSQKDPLDNLVKLLQNESYKDNADIQKLIADLSPLHQTYNSVTEGGISEEQLENIKTTVHKVRSEIVNF